MTIIGHKAPGSLYTPQCDFRWIERSNPYGIGCYVSISN